MNLDTPLSPHFLLREFTRTSHKLIDNTPSAEDVYRLTRLCNWVLEPLRSQFGALHVNSGFRCPALNNAVGGSPTSAHLSGCAADVVPARNVSIGQMMAWLSTSVLPFDQAIDELNVMGDGWLHIAIPPPGASGDPRRDMLVMRGGKYSPWPDDVSDVPAVGG
jgi:hypothetical protein